MAPPYSGPDCDLTPNATHIVEFCKWWFDKCTSGRIEVGWLDATGRGLIHFVQFDIGEWSELAAVAVQSNLVPGQSMYIRAATVQRKDTFSLATGYTEDKDFIQSPGIWSDLDTPEQMDLAKSVKTLLRPNASVITGSIPHLRVQNWFKCDVPIVNHQMVRDMNGGLLRLYGGDTAVVNPTRLMRLPGTIAWPWKKGRTAPEITVFVPPSPSDPRPASYPLALMASQLPAEGPASKSSASSAPPLSATLNTVADMIRLIQAGDNWHDRMVRLTAHWIGRGWSNAEILAACECLTLPGYTQAQTRAEVAKAVEGGRTKWGVTNQDHFLGSEPDKPFPDTVTDPWDSLQAPEFPVHALPPILQAFVASRSRIMGADPCAIAWACLSACSAALDGRVRLRLKKHDAWSVPPGIWVALIGRSSAKKTPIINDAWRPLEEMQRRALSAYADEVRRWKTLPKDEQKGNEPTKPRRLLTHDATMEGLQDILAYQDRGIGVIRDELAGFIGSMDKYSGGGRGGAADRAFWLQAYNGGAHVVDRVGRGTTAINNLLATICGGIQPDRLAQFADLADDGLWQRFVPIIMRPGEMGLDEVEPTDIVQAYSAHVESMVERVRGGVQATLSDGAHAIRHRLECDMFQLEQEEPLGGRFASFTGKMPGLFGRLCLVLSYLQPAGLGFIVSEDHARSAYTLIKQCVIPHAAKVYEAMGCDGGSLATSQSIAGYLLTKKLSRVLISDLTSNVRPCRNQSVSDVVKMISPLVAGGWLSPQSDLPGNKAWLVNPVVHVTFSNRAQTEVSRRATARGLITGEIDE